MVTQSMVVHLHDISHSERRWTWRIPAQRMMAEEGTVEPLEAVCGDTLWQGSICCVDGIYQVHGDWQVTLVRQCVRCLCDFEWTNKQSCDAQYSLHPLREMDEEAQADIEVLPAHGELNLMDVLREDIWLAWESCVVCKETCKGLCQKCGMDLNQGDCSCNQLPEDHPFAALAAMKFDT